MLLYIRVFICDRLNTTKCSFIKGIRFFVILFHEVQMQVGWCAQTSAEVSDPQIKGLGASTH